MASQFTIPIIISIYKISSYLSGNDIAQNLAFKSGTLKPLLQKQILMEGYIMEQIYNLNSSDPQIRSTAEYVLSLCGKYSIDAENILNGFQQAKPIVSGPSNQSVSVGQNAIFSVSVVSSLPVFYQWYGPDDLPISGANSNSYTIINAQTSQSGNTYYVKVSNAAGVATSNTATLTVTASIILSAYYTDTDPTAAIQSQTDNFAYQYTVSVIHNQPIIIPIPQAASNNKWWVWRVVNTEQVDNTWFNTSLNNGQIPDSVFQTPASFNNNTYYYLRNASSFDYTQPLVLSKV